MDQELKEYFENAGYHSVREVPGRGVCGIANMLFTFGICYNLNDQSYEGRYCFPDVYSAILALESWDGNGDPGGPWIKHKGKTEYKNPNF